MKNIFKKRIISLIVISVVLIGGLFAKSTILLSAGSISSVFFYDQNGLLINNVNKYNISVDETLVIKSTTSKVVFTYKYGKIVLDKNSILVMKEKDSAFTFYLVDGTTEISSKAISFGKVNIITPVTSYTLKSEGEIKVISTDKKESFELFSGSATIYNSITGQTYNVNENNKMELNTPVLVALNNLDKKDSRKTFLNTKFPFNVVPITKSDDNLDQFVLNIIATGNGQGNVNLLNFATFKGILNEADKKNEKYLLIDAGNTLSGSVYVNQDKGNTASQVLNKVGYDVFVPGSYDFAYGYKQLQKLDNESNVKFISTNVLTSDDYNILTPYQLYAYNDLRVAVIGLSNPSKLTQLDNLKFNSDIIINNAQAAIDMAREYVNLVILVTNYSDEYINSKVIAKNLKGIDLIIDGSKSMAGTYKEDDTYIISTGVGYNKIVDTQISVYKNNLISVNPIIVHSSNILTDNNNQLASALNVYEFENDSNLENYLSSIKLKDGYSSYLIAPDSKTITTSSVLTGPNKPKFNDFIIRTSVKQDMSDKEQVELSKPVFTKVNTVKDIEEEPVVEPIKIAMPTFTNVTTTKVIEKDTVVEPIEIKKPIFTKFVIRKSAPVEDSVSTTDLITDDTETKLDKDDILVKNATEDISIQSIDEIEKKSTTSIGIKTTADAKLTATNYDFDDYNLPLSLAIKPYFESENLTLALYVDATMSDALDANGRTINYSVDPLPSNTIKSIYQYSINLIDELTFSLFNNNLNFDLSKNTFSSPIKSALTYRSLGSDNLKISGNLQLGALNTEAFLTDATLEAYYSGSAKEKAGLVETLSLLDNNLTLQVAGLAIGQSGIITAYPIVSSTLNFKTDSTINLAINVNGSTLVLLRPNFDYDTIKNNYLVGSSLVMNYKNLDLELGVNYLATDNSAFNTNIFHEEFYKNNLFNTLDNKSLIPFVSLKHNTNILTTYLSYTLPFSVDSSEFENDLFDFSFDYETEKFSIGLFYLQSNLIDSISNYSNLKDYFFADNVEFGLNSTWNITDWISSTLKSGVTSTTNNPLYLDLSFTLDLDKNI